MTSENSEMMTEQDMRDSETAVKQSQGQNMLRIDLSPTKDNLYAGTIYVGQPS